MARSRVDMKYCTIAFSGKFCMQMSMKVKLLWEFRFALLALEVTRKKHQRSSFGRNEVFRWKECVTDNVYVTNIPKAPKSNDKRSINGSPFWFLSSSVREFHSVHLSKDVTSSCNGENNELSVTMTSAESNGKFCLIPGSLIAES